MADLHFNTDNEIFEHYYPIGGAKLVKEHLPRLSIGYIYTKANKLGLKSNLSTVSRKFTEHEDNMIREHYPANGYKGLENILPNRSKQSIQQRAFQIGVKYLTYNENYFSSIDTPDKAYWLGFVYTDGYITEKTTRFGIELSIVDKNHLQKLLNQMQSNMVIRERVRDSVFGRTREGDYHSCSILINNKQIHSDLIDLGVNSNKTKNISFPKNDIVPDNLKIHFIRGLIDGDGSIGLYDNNGYKKPSIILVSAVKGFLEEIMNYLYEKLRLKFYIDNKENVYVLRSSSKDTVKRFIELIYLNSNEGNRLDRKYKIAEEIIGYFDKDWAKKGW